MEGKFYLETYGCQMNASESFSLERELKNRGWQQVDRGEDADLVVLNTCAVRKSAEQRIHGRIGHYQHLKESRDLSLVVMGCMTERMQTGLRDAFPAVNMLVGTFGKQEFINFLAKTENLSHNRDFFGGEIYEFLSAEVSPGGHSAFIPIMHGCNNFCTYCIVPYVRGREVSRSYTDIIDEVHRLDNAGVKEITLIGQNVNSYRDDSGFLFPELLEKISTEVDSIEWIRFMSSHPKDLSPRLIEVMADNPRVCRHLHLPVQHGADPVLKRMNRKYTRENYLSLVQDIRKAIPGLSLTTDLLIGFPGETEKDFEDTIKLLEEVRYDDAFTYKYNTREGTAAAGFSEQVPEEIKTERLTMLIDKQREITEDNKKSRLLQPVKVLVEGPSRKNREELLGRTERNEMIVFSSDTCASGDFLELVPQTLSGVTFRM